MATTRIEVETLTNSLIGYIPETATFASGGGLIRIPNDGNIGTVTHNFDLASGKYDIVVAYYDEGDGKSPFALKQKTADQNWTNLATWTASGNTNSADTRASASNLTLFKQSGVNLTAGDEIQVQGQLNSGEVARVDYIEYIPVTTDTTAPTATATANDTTLTSGSNSGYTFTVTYSDDQAVKVSSLDNNDIRVTGPNSFDQLATFVKVDTNSNGTPRTATYSIAAPGGSWDSNEAGTYSVAVAANQVSDTSNNAVVSGTLDTFNVNVEVPPSDTTAPTATATANDTTLTSGSNSSYTFTVTYSDNQAVKVSSLDNNDIRVTGPNSFDQLATFVKVDTNSDGTPRTATYSIAAPGGSWDSNEAGTYSVAVAASQVSDTSNNTVASSTLDTFNVTVQTPSATPPKLETIEAEKMGLTGGYEVNSGNFASGGKFIRLNSSKGATGTAATGFTGESGAYDIVVKYFDENDGVSDLSIGVQGTTVEAWKADQNLGGGNASAQTLTEKVIKNVQINKSDKIEINGTINSGENARVDRIDFVPTDNTAPTASLTTNNINVTSGDSQAYTFTVQYSDNFGVDLSTIDSKDIKVTGPNGFSKDATLVSSSLSSDGKVATATYKIDPPGSYWNIQEAGTYTIAMQSNQVLDLVNNPVAANDKLGTFKVSVNSSGDNVNYSQASKGVYVNLETEIGSIPDPSKTLKVMPLGDSITAGKENSNQLEADWVGYRKELYEDFKFFNVPIDLVGSQTNGAFAENQHQGHPGWTINDIKNGKSTVPGSGVNNWLPTSTPNVVLLMIGTNDAGGNVDTMKSRLDSLIKTITANSSFDNGNLLVSTIPPIHPNSSYISRKPNVEAYNKSIPDIVAQQPASEKVSFVNMWQGSNALKDTDMTPPPADNGLHPTQAGYQKMAYHWFDSILSNTQQKDILADKTNVQGSAYKDMIFGNASSNNLEGGDGADQITGGAGGDTFTYSKPNQGQDILTDFNPSQGDVFAISAAGFGAGLVAGKALSTTASNTGVFVSGSALNYLGNMAHFFYNTSTGLLSFDPDGSNAQPLTPLATLTTKPTLTANQFTIV